MNLQEDVALTLELSDSNIELSNGFDFLQKLQYLEARVFPLSAWMKSTELIVDALKETEKPHQHDCHGDDQTASTALSASHGLTSYKIQLHGHMISTEVLEKRIQGTLRLVTENLSIAGDALY